MGIGGALGFIIIASFYYQTYLGADVALIILLTGIVCTSRMLLSQHNSFQVYAGLIAGITCQLLGYWVGR